MLRRPGLMPGHFKSFPVSQDAKQGAAYRSLTRCAHNAGEYSNIPKP